MKNALFDASRFALLAERLEAEGIGVDSDTVELPSDRLSGPELRLWFIDQLEPHAAVYTIAAGLRIRGPLDVATLERAVVAVADRHDALRTRFPTVDGMPSVVVDPTAATRLTVEPVAEHDLGPWADGHARTPFDLATGPLFRAALARVSDADHALVLTIHHIVIDGAGLDVVVQELLAGALGGLGPSGAPDPRRVVEPNPARKEAELAFWRSELEALPGDVAVARDRDRPLVPSRDGGRLTRELDRSTRAAVAACAPALGTTAAVVYQAAFRCLLALHSTEDDVGVGIPVNLREPGDEGRVANLVNTVVIRTRIGRNPRFRDVVATTARSLAGALQHRRVGFEAVVQALGADRELSRTPLFSVSFAHHASPLASTTSLAGVTISPLPVSTGTAMFDLALQIAEWQDSTGAHLAYAADLYDETTAGRLLDAYARVLAAFATDPDARLGDVDVLETRDASTALAHSVPSVGPSADAFGLAGRFAVLARSQPDAPALSWAGQSLTYGELNRRSLALASALDRLGLPREGAVALLVERGPDLVAGMIACARLGLPYVPLDDEHPPRRHAEVIAAARPAAVLGSPRLLALLEGPLPPCVDVTRVPERDEAPEPERPLPGDTAVYTIFTSGSTGRPKGVVVTHANVLSLVDATDARFGLSPADVWSFPSSCAFDVSVWEIWGALSTGGRVAIVPRDCARDPYLFLEALEREAVTILNQTPSAFRSLQHTAVAERRLPPASLRLVVFGGEALHVRELEPWFELAGERGPQLVNMYGITETTVHVTAQLIDAETASRSTSPIGVPLDHLSTLLLDERLRPVPPGVPGELYVGGAGVARGYLHEPGRTATRFVPNSYVPGGRLYRSGDRARRLADGTLEFIGRWDDQVKIRGFRVEPAEAEAALAAVDGVETAAVVVHEGRLVGYVVGDVDPVEVRGLLGTRLPNFLVPSVVIRIPALPLTPNGKLDRKGLPTPALERTASAVYVAPSGPAEEALAAAFRKALGLAELGAGDNFFELGGDSIRAVQVAAAARAAGLAVSVADVFADPTVSGLAAGASAVAPERRAVAPFSLVADEDRAALPAGVVDAYPLTTLQAGMLFHQEFGDEIPAYHNVTSVEVGAPFVTSLLQEAADRVVARHPVLRTTVELAAYGEPLQLVWRFASMRIDVHDLRGLPRIDQERTVNRAMEVAYREALPLDEAPLLRLVVHRADDDRFWLTFVECHAMLDGWSFTSTIAEILGLYGALADGRDPGDDPAPALSFAEHVAAERAAVADVGAAAYFDELLADAPEQALGMLGPAGAPEPGVHKRLVPVAPSVQRRLEEVARARAVSMKHVLLAAHAAVIGALSGREDIVTGVVVNGRPEVDGGDDARGLYLNTLPMRLGLRRRTFGELVEAVYATETELWRHRLYPGRLALARSRDRRTYLSDFNYTRFRPLSSVADGPARLIGSIRELGHVDIPLAASFDHGHGEPSSHLALLLECSRASFDAAATDTVADVYLRMLAALADDPDRRVDSVALTGGHELHRIEQANRTGRRYEGAELPLHEAVERAAAATPDAVAVVDGTGSLTYAELTFEARRLATVLRRRGVAPESRVGLELRRSRRLPVAQLAVSAAGGAFVPIDPDLPGERRALIAAEARLSLLLGDAELDEALREAQGMPMLEPVAVPSSAACYVMFTSGSTGRPKGVVVEHRALVNRVSWMQERYALCDGDAVLHKTPASFDPSLVELYWPLTAGRRLVVLEPDAQFDTEAIVKAIEREAVTACLFVPSLLRVFATEADPARCTSLRHVFAGGEALGSGLVRDWRRRFAARIVNLYGPTETTVDVATWAGDEQLDRATAPIGDAVANTQLHLLSAGLEEPPPGVACELYVGGIQLARGYESQPGLTATRFVPDPFGVGTRLYRTGDLVRRLPAGSFEYVGRADGQLKVNGVRIEPAEVESALAAVAGVRRVAVAVPNGRLVAFVEGDVDASGVRAAVARTLPPALVPARVVVLDELPTTPGGKVDRSALRVPAGAAAAYEPPRDDRERVLASCFAAVLDHDRVGIHDDFFELGGDSIASFQVVARARAHGLAVSPRDVFELATVAELARVADAVLQAEAPAPSPPPSPEPDLSALTLDAAGADALLDRLEKALR